MIRLPKLKWLRRSETKSGGDRNRDKVIEPYDAMEAHEKWAAFRERAAANLPIIGSIVVVLFVVSKVLLVARGDVSTALAIVNRAGPFQVLTGTMIIVSPLLAIGILAVLTARPGDELSPPERRRLYWFLAALIAWLSLMVIYVSTVTLLGYSLVMRLKRRRKRQKVESSNRETSAARVTDQLLLQIKEPMLQLSPSDSRLQALLQEIKTLESTISTASRSEAVDLAEIQRRRAEQVGYIREYYEREQDLARVRRRSLDVIAAGLMLAATVPLLPQAFDDKPWLPAEVVELSDRSVEYGYVLDHDSQWLVILTLEERQILSVDVESVQSRTICVDGEGGVDGKPTRTIWRLFARLHQRYDDCGAAVNP